MAASSSVERDPRHPLLPACRGAARPEAERRSRRPSKPPRGPARGPTGSSRDGCPRRRPGAARPPTLRTRPRRNRLRRALLGERLRRCEFAVVPDGRSGHDHGRRAPSAANVSASNRSRTGLRLSRIRRLRASSTGVADPRAREVHDGTDRRRVYRSIDPTSGCHVTPSTPGGIATSASHGSGGAPRRRAPGRGPSR